MNRGFIVLWRKFQNTSFYKDSLAFHLAVHLILEANHEPKKFVFNSKEETLERGQHLTGRLKLSQEIGLPPSTIRNKLKLLQNVGFLDIKSTNKFSIVTICNYNTYQDTKTKKGQHIGQPEDNQRTTKGQPKDTNNNTTTITTKTSKSKYLTFVSLTTEEHQKLTSRFGEEETARIIYELNNYIGKFGDKYKSHYYTILSWEAKNERDRQLTNA